MMRTLGRTAVLVIATALVLPGGPAAAAPSGPQQIGFAPAVAYPTGARPLATATADVDGDGDLDILATGERRTELLVSRGNGSFAPGVLAAPIPGRALAVGDLNSDGAPDLVIARIVGRTAVLLNRGDGSFGPARLLAPSGAPQLADVTGDGRLDLLVPDGTTGVRLFAGDGTGRLVERAAVVDDDRVYVGVVAADLDGDGDLDVAVAVNGVFFNPSRVRTFRNDGAGNFRATGSEVVTGQQFIADLAAGDVDEDGAVDFVAVGAGKGAFVRGDGTGRLLSSTPIALTGAPDSVLLADLDADGNLDLAVGNQQTAPVTLAGNGSGAFAPAVALAAAGQGLSGGDLDSDGDLDLAVADPARGTVGVLRNLG